MSRTLLATTLALLVLAPGAWAQSNATGNIFGSTGSPGDTVTVKNLGTGIVRNITVDGSGRYRATSLPVGQYNVTLERDGKPVASQEDVTVLLGSGTEASFSQAGATTLDAIVVTGSNASLIDVSSADTRTVFTAEQLQEITVSRDINSLALLTPGVVAADSRYGNAASFGGSSASENAIYINGYAVTNPLTNLGSTTLPFDGISQYQAITGGYGAEFGRATGGVVNIITKRGSNDWKFGAQAVWNPDSGRATRKDIFYPTGTGYATDGILFHNRAQYEEDSLSYGAYVSGPIIQDRLFFYAGGEFTRRDVSGIVARASANANTGYQEYDYETPRWLAKVDWYINDNHLLELTGISDVTKQTDVYHGYSYANGQINYGVSSGFYYEDGGELYIGKYTGRLTDNLTLTALYGQQKQEHVAIPSNFNPDPSAVYVTDSRPNVTRVSGLQQVSTLSDPEAYDETDGGRLDLEWQVGQHALRLGYDRQNLESRRGVSTTGPGYWWDYANTTTPNATINGSGGAAGPGGNGDYVVRRVRQGGGTFKVEQEAQYIEDRWQVNDQWLVVLGLRNEQFTNFNSAGEAYVSQRHQLAPRAGVSWDVNGDSSFKVFANLGRYHLALPSNVAYRGASPSTITGEYFAFTGIDPTTGVPTGLRALGDGPYSANSEYGQAKDPRTIAATDLKSHFQDELVIGFEKLVGERLNFGTRLVYRDLKSAIDDFCDPRPGIEWAEANGVDPYLPGGIYDSFHSCRLFNPGENNTYTVVDDAGTVTTVPLTAESIGIPKLKRRYLGIDFLLEYPFDGKLYGKLDYTWSKNYGNAEGQLLSDFGQGDVSQTLNFDHRELAIGANGYLPNDRRHFIKAFGYYQFNPQWQVSGTFTAASGRPLNKYGIYPDGDDFFYDDIFYGPYYHYVDGELSPRGSAGRLAWTTRFDVGVTWRPAFAGNKLQVRADVFNIFDRQVVQSVNEIWENPNVGDRYQQAWRTLSYSSPRSARLQIRYDY